MSYFNFIPLDVFSFMLSLSSRFWVNILAENQGQINAQIEKKKSVYVYVFSGPFKLIIWAHS